MTSTCVPVALGHPLLGTPKSKGVNMRIGKLLVADVLIRPSTMIPEGV